MRSLWPITVACLAALGCAADPAFHAGRSALKKEERQALIMKKNPNREGLARLWKSNEGTPTGLLKWSEATSSATTEAPPDLLERTRDELGRLNRSAGSGPDQLVSLTVYEYRRRWWGPAEVSYELVGRDPAGRLLWAADDTVRVSKAMAISEVDTESDIFARLMVARLRPHLTPP